ncbi:MAG: prolyl oligopeptidase family serine peptidase [candidate division KSB1 bacterium]|nr:prolyl oligopeptidase family serine peptidase [candidate division KSB1 bacterium]
MLFFVFVFLSLIASAPAKDTNPPAARVENVVDEYYGVKVNDPRVEPWNSAKMTARLQAASGSDNPILFRVDYSSGHGIGSTRQQYLEELADEWAFLLWQFGE